MSVDITWDIESNNLLNDESIDYTKSPYTLKDTYRTHSIVIERHDTKEIIAFYNGDKYILDGRRFEESDDKYTYVLEDYEGIEYTHYQLDEFPDYIASLDLDKVVGHNTINFDHLSCKLYFDMEYSVGHSLEDVDTWHGQCIDIVDTMILSKVLNPDRFGGHSLDNIAKMAKQDMKLGFRKGIRQEDRFKTFAADMLYYNIFDVKANTSIYNYLLWEKGLEDWNWEPAICLENKVAEIVTRSSHRGFNFDKELAEKNIKELDELMETRRDRVEPLLPPRRATKKFLKEHTPPASQILEKEIAFPKSFFNQKGEVSKTGQNWLEKWEADLHPDEDEIWIISRGITIKKDYDANDDGNYGFPPVAFVEKSMAAHIKKFAEKHGGSYDEESLTITVFGETMGLPIEVEPMKTTMVATIDDVTHIKEWLVSLGWQPSEYKMKDITLKSGTKIKREAEDLEKAVDRYVEETMSSEFCRDRCTHMKARTTPSSLKSKIMKKAEKYGCKVLTSPSFTVGQEKELCKVLERIAESFPYVKDIVEYLTFKHRRSSILGGGVEWEDEEEAEKGYLANIRADGRISTNCDTLGAGTGRMKHKGVVNVPRVSSLYGKEMRGLFKVADNCYKVGADFASLEARSEGHYCYRYDIEDKPYCQSLTLSQPYDVHTITAQGISEVLGKEFGRTPAKSVKYGLTFGAMAAKIAAMLGVDLKTGEGIVNAFWDSAKPLADLKKAVEKWWNSKGNKKYIIGLDGRKVGTRFQHALLNSLFQSFGAIATKTMAVFYDKLLLDEGLMVDFFKDDWANMRYAQLMIIMHDEVAMEETKDNFTWKKFSSQEKALQFIEEDGRIWSEMIKRGDKVYIGYSRASELIHTAVDMTNNHFKLKVPLEMGYVIGMNWSQTH